MGNPHKGEVSLTAGGETYTLKYSVDAICRLEESTGKNLTTLMTEMADASKMSLTMTRHMVHAALFEHHPEVTLKEAGEIMEANGGMLQSLAKVVEAIQIAFPEASGTPRPPNRAARRKAGTGRAS
ncbi:hypothetical protein RPMA_18320 [Tardiphaga alba]|uniref:Tail tube GTA-gp10-like protein n=1 Tax=Tardiphaga alba TaxID=340268 RepID=A0ABX8A9Y1_9BRAD|nr:hypothetical protein [Tardiphaga alba]QUS40574.1 hypothetical protein RPMA_18320 [Tardiphaga alba]